MNNPNPNDVLHEILAELADGKLSDEQFHLLDQMMTSDPAIREEYRKHVELLAMLQFEHRPQPASEETASQAATGKCAAPAIPDLTPGFAGDLDHLVIPPSNFHGSNFFDSAGPAGGVLGAVSSLFRPPMVFLTLFVAVVSSVFCGVWMAPQFGPSGQEVGNNRSPILADGTIHDPQQAARPHLAQQAGPHLAGAPAAYLVSGSGCEWRGANGRLRTLGGGVQVGDEINLHEGIAEFRLESGVSLSIEGPASMVIVSPSSLLMQHGKFFVRVPWSVSDFRATTASCRIGASDAEFGVDVAENKVSVHVFSGEVVASSYSFGDSPTRHAAAGGWSGQEDGIMDDSIADDSVEVLRVARRESDLPRAATFTEAIIGPGRALELAGDGGNRGQLEVLHWKSADENEFATKLSMSGSLPVSTEYINQVLESSPVGYWRFEKSKAGVIENEIAGGVDLAVVGDVRLIGDSGNRVAELGIPGSVGFLVSREPLPIPTTSDYSFELWIKPSHIHRGGLLLMVQDPYHTGATQPASYVELRGPSQRSSGRIRFLHRDPPGKDPSTGTNCFSTEAYRLRRWQQVVAVKHRGEMRLYLNGQLVGTARDDSAVASGLFLVVGRNGANLALPLRPFVGQLDELSVYDRALTEKEIQKRYESMNWESMNGLPERQIPERKNEA